MISKDKASEIADSLISDKRSVSNESRIKRVNFFYGHLIGKEYIEKYSESPNKIIEAVKYAYNSSLIAILFIVFLLGATAFIFFLDGTQNISVILIFCLGFSVFLRGKVRAKAIEYLDNGGK